MKPRKISGSHCLPRGIRLPGSRRYKIAKIKGKAKKKRKKVSANGGNSPTAIFPVINAPDQKMDVSTIKS